jgi:hypothetical protein
MRAQGPIRQIVHINSVLLKAACLDRVICILHQPITASLPAMVRHGHLGKDLRARAPVSVGWWGWCRGSGCL